MSNDAPPWPSLYNPAIDLIPIQYREPIQPKGKYLRDANDIFRFTLYWTIVLYVPAFVVCGVYAFFNLSFPPRRPLRKGLKARPQMSRFGSSNRSGTDSESLPLRRFHGLGAHTHNRSQFHVPSRSPAKQNERRSRLTFALIVVICFAVLALGGAVVGSAAIGYVLAGLFRAAKYDMSTWIPLLGALIQTLVAYLALWPTVIDII